MKYDVCVLGYREAELDTNAKGNENEGKSQGDEREACIMCGACEIIGQVCALHAYPEDE
jgi:hypothetical protein